MRMAAIGNPMPYEGTNVLSRRKRAIRKFANGAPEGRAPKLIGILLPQLPWSGLLWKRGNELILEFPTKSMLSGFSWRCLQCKYVLIFPYAHADCALTSWRSAPP